MTIKPHGRYEATVAPQLSYDKQKNKVGTHSTALHLNVSSHRPDRVRIHVHQIIMRVFTPSAAKQLALAPVDVRRSDPRTGEEVRGLGRVSTLMNSINSAASIP